MTQSPSSFPGAAMAVPHAKRTGISAVARKLIAGAKAAGLFVFADAIHQGVAPVPVSADGATSLEVYPASHLGGGLTVLEQPSRDQAARRIAAAYRCVRTLRGFMNDSAA